MRIVLSLLLMTSFAQANEVLTPTIKEPTRQEVEAAVARCDNPNLGLKKDPCEVVRNRLKVLNGELPKDYPINSVQKPVRVLPQ